MPPQHVQPRRRKFLRGFEHVEIPYEEVWEMGGFTPGDNFPGLRLLSAAQGDALLAGLRIATITAAEEEAAAERADVRRWQAGRLHRQTRRIPEPA